MYFAEKDLETYNDIFDICECAMVWTRFPYRQSAEYVQSMVNRAEDLLKKSFREKLNRNFSNIPTKISRFCAKELMKYGA